MNETIEIEVYKQHREIQNKYTYFLLAVAASCIALSLKRTTDSKITYSMIPLALAVLSWGFSFFCGCCFLRYASGALAANFKLMATRKGEHPDVGNNPQAIAEASKILKKTMETKIKKTGSFSAWQFRWLILGALFFIAWHVIGMIELTINATV